MKNVIDGVPYHKTTINLPKSMYEDMKRESKVLGINFNALVLIKLNKLKEQDHALDSLTIIANALTKNMKQEEYDKLFKGYTNKDK